MDDPRVIAVSAIMHQADIVIHIRAHGSRCSGLKYFEGRRPPPLCTDVRLQLEGTYLVEMSPGAKSW